MNSMPLYDDGDYPNERGKALYDRALQAIRMIYRDYRAYDPEQVDDIITSAHHDARAEEPILDVFKLIDVKGVG